MRADGMTGVFDIQVHSFRYAADFGGNHRFSLGKSRGGLDADVTQPVMRRHKQMTDGNDALHSDDAPRHGIVKPPEPDNSRPYARNGPGEPRQLYVGVRSRLRNNND